MESLTQRDPDEPPDAVLGHGSLPLVQFRRQGTPEDVGGSRLRIRGLAAPSRRCSSAPKPPGVPDNEDDRSWKYPRPPFVRPGGMVWREQQSRPTSASSPSLLQGGRASSRRAGSVCGCIGPPISTHVWAPVCIGEKQVTAVRPQPRPRTTEAKKAENTMHCGKSDALPRSAGWAAKAAGHSCRVPKPAHGMM